MNLRDGLNQLIPPAAPPAGVSYTWATITGLTPLRVRIDGESAPLGVDTDTILEPYRLGVGLRVLILHQRNRITIVGASEGGYEKPIWFESSYAPDMTGTLPSSEATAMIVSQRDIPPATYDRVLSGEFNAWFSYDTNTALRHAHAGFQIITTGTNPTPNSEEHITEIWGDGIATQRSMNLGIERLIPANASQTVRMIQWGYAQGAANVVDGNGLAFTLVCR